MIATGFLVSDPVRLAWPQLGAVSMSRTPDTESTTDRPCHSSLMTHPWVKVKLATLGVAAVERSQSRLTGDRTCLREECLQGCRLNLAGGKCADRLAARECTLACQGATSPPAHPDRDWRFRFMI